MTTTANLKHLKKEEEQTLLKSCEEFSDIFHLEEEPLTCTAMVEHEINIWAIKHFRLDVYETKFKIVIDHKPLIRLFNINDLGSRLIRWRLKLEEYDYEIIHKVGWTNANANALSRNAIPRDPRNENNNHEVLIIEKEEEEKEQEDEASSEQAKTFTEVEKKQILSEYHDALIVGYQGIKRIRRTIRLQYN